MIRLVEEVDLTKDEELTENDMLQTAVAESMTLYDLEQSPEAPPYSPLSPVFEPE